MRWIYLILGVIGLCALAQAFFKKQFAMVAYTVPGLHLGLTWGMVVVALFVGAGIAKLKFGK